MFTSLMLRLVIHAPWLFGDSIERRDPATTLTSDVYPDAERLHQALSTNDEAFATDRFVDFLASLQERKITRPGQQRDAAPERVARTEDRAALAAPSRTAPGTGEFGLGADGRPAAEGVGTVTSAGTVSSAGTAGATGGTSSAIGAGPGGAAAVKSGA